MASGRSTPSFAAGARNPAERSTQVSTTTLLNALHTIYASGQTYRLDASTSLVVNTWLTASSPGVDGHHGGTVDRELARQAWEHARRRAEDGCVVLGSLHHSTPSLLVPFIDALPLSLPSTLFTALSVIKPFTHCVTPYNPSTSRHSALAATFRLTLAGNINAVTLALSQSGLDVHRGLLNIPQEAGYRAFDVFYYLLTSASTPAEREFLSLKRPAAYSLLNRSGTFEPPSYLATADDTAAAEDFRSALKDIGIKGSSHRNLLSTLAGLLKLGETVGLLIDQEDLEDICDDAGGLLGIDPEILLNRCSTEQREIVISGLYEALVDWVLKKANEAISADIASMKDDDYSSTDDSGRLGLRTPRTDEDVSDTVSITVVEIPSHDLGKAVCLRGVFDDNEGINAEMKVDGIDVTQAGSSVIKEMHNAVSDVAADLGLTTTPASRDKESDRNRQLQLLGMISEEAEPGGFLQKILRPICDHGQENVNARMDLSAVLGSSRAWYHLCLHPTDESLSSLGTLASNTSAWSAGTVSKQLRDWRLPEWANYRNKSLDFTADFDVDEFCTRYSRLGCQDGRDGVESWILERGWSNGEVVIGHERVWIREGAWWEAESMLDLKPNEMSRYSQSPFETYGGGMESGYSNHPGLTDSGFFPPMDEDYGSRDNLIQQHQSSATLGENVIDPVKSFTPSMAGRTVNTKVGDYGLGAKGDDKKGDHTYYDDEINRINGGLDPELADPKSVTKETLSTSRRIWVTFVWALTCWIPSFLLRYVGRMKRPDVRFAWREKIVLIMIIFLLNAIVIFYIVEFGRLLCPNFDKAWNQKEVSYHQGDTDFWVSIHGKVYDITKFAQITHGDIQPYADKTSMLPLAGMNLDEYFPVPLQIGCQYLVMGDSTDTVPVLQSNTTPTYPNALHKSGAVMQQNTATKLHNDDWYTNNFLPTIKEYYKGDLVALRSDISKQASDSARQWVILNDAVYDLTDYFYTKKLEGNIAMYSFIPPEVETLIQQNVGGDITSQWKANSPDYQKTLACMNNVFYEGKTDFRYTARCQVNNYILLAFTIILCSVILIKFLSALQFGSKRRPVAQDKFVICQVPAYTEGEDQLRKGLDSLTALQYDNKRKLICVVCDGMIVGGGNDRPTPKIVLDILGVDPKIDPPALPFKAIGQGNEQLNYGKVYSGLYEFEGNVVPYIVVVKVGKESEQTKSKPGNRGKRDSQIMLMSFLNRVHHRSPMSPLELEMFHQINNIIGVDPELYEYLFMVDADTSVREDSLNRLVASCANDAKIAGICGETSLQNEERTWWTMIQVYEYYISHHLAKAFESLFGSVTCLPGW